MTKLTEHFNLEEFACHSGEPVPTRFIKNVLRLADQLEEIRELIGNRPIKILSGYRSEAWNEKVKGAKHSQHLTASAADIVVEGMHPIDLANEIRHFMQMGMIIEGGLGIYNNWVHYDIRGTETIWHTSADTNDLNTLNNC
jgi:uncharacterized protein YcbK (DUF882 family)